MSMDFVTLGGNLLGTIPLGDIVLYITPFNLFLFAVLLGFTLLIGLSKTETQIEATFHTLDNTEVKVDEKEFRQRRFLSVICGIASAGAMITGDLFNFTLFMALVGILNIGIVSAVKQTTVLNSAFNYGLIAMMCSLPLFGGGAGLQRLAFFVFSATKYRKISVPRAIDKGVCGKSAKTVFIRPNQGGNSLAIHYRIHRFGVKK